jgi:hypothetical protein
MKPSGCLLAVLLVLTGCSTVETQVETTTEVRRYHHLYVRRASNDSNNVDLLLVQELQRLGYDASSGPRTMMPDDTDVVIDYEGQWTWDFRIYLIELKVTVRNARTEEKLGGGRVFHPGITNMSPEEFVHRLLAPMFGPKETKK